MVAIHSFMAWDMEGELLQSSICALDMPEHFCLFAEKSLQLQAMVYSWSVATSYLYFNSEVLFFCNPRWNSKKPHSRDHPHSTLCYLYCFVCFWSCVCNCVPYLQSGLQE